MLTLLPVTWPITTLALQEEACRLYSETGKKVCGKFLEYWERHGGLPVFGYPISDLREEVSDINGRVYTVQYFERTVFEAHPDNAAPYDVLLPLIGFVHYKQKYPAVPPRQVPSSSADSINFPETGKRIGGRFLAYWQANEGLSNFGYPITDEVEEISPLNGKTYRMQYFERAVFELHSANQPPNDILLTQLGTLRFHTLGKVSPGIDAEFKYDHRVKRRFWVILAEQADTTNDIRDWSEQGWYVYNKLKEVADRTQPPVAAYLHEQRIAGNVENFTSFYIKNAFSVLGNLQAARAAATLSGVGRVEEAPNTLTFP